MNPPRRPLQGEPVRVNSCMKDRNAVHPGLYGPEIDFEVSFFENVERLKDEIKKMEIDMEIV